MMSLVPMTSPKWAVPTMPSGADGDLAEGVAEASAAGADDAQGALGAPERIWRPERIRHPRCV